MSLYSDLNEVLTPYAQRIKGLSAANEKIKADLDDKAYDIGSYNRFDPSTVSGGIINKQGTVVDNAYWSHSDFIPVLPGMVLYAKGHSATSYALYDKSRKLVTNSTDWANPYTVPNGVYFIKMSFQNSALSTSTAYMSTKNQFDIFKKLAKYAQDGIAGLESDIAGLQVAVDYSYVEIVFSFVRGALSSIDGNLDTSNNWRISSAFIPMLTEKIRIHVDTKYQSNVFFYSKETGGFLSSSGWLDGDCVIGDGLSVPSGTKLIRISLRNKADATSNISPSDIQVGEVKFEYLIRKADTNDLAKYDPLFVPTSSPNIMYVCRDSRVRNDIPPNSSYAIKATAYNQYDRVRFSVTKTTDGEYVAVHDVTINGLAVNPDGTAISTTINTADCSLAELNQYDWGLKYGTQYAGLQVPMLDDCLKLASIYNLGVVLDIKWTVNDDDIDALTAMLAKYGQIDAIFFAVNPVNAAKFKAKNKRFSYLFAGTYEQMQTQEANLLGLLTGYNHIYLANRPLGTAPTTDIINFACVNNFDIMYSPIEGMDELTTLGFDKGITLMECHYIENIKKSVIDYADSLID